MKQALIGLVALVVFFPLALILMIGGSESDTTCSPDAVTAITVPDSLGRFTKEQLSNAAQVLTAGADLGLSARDQTIGIMTALGESDLVVLDYGDSAGPDSRGLFQQRAEGWGSYEDRMDPYKSATSFFKVLAQVEGRDSLTPTQVAHRVQRNADPNHYAKWWSEAQQIVTALSGSSTVSTETTTSSDGSSSRYNLGPVNSWVASAANTLGRQFGIKTIGGYRPGNTYDYEGHPAGLAIDLMTNDAGGKAVGDQLAAYAQANASQLSIKYIIWYQHIWSTARADEGWRAMEDRGSVSANHQDHVHISFEETASGDSSALSDAGTSGGCSSTTSTSTTISGDWAAPANDLTISSPYGMRVHPVTGVYKLHSGVDYPGGGCDAPIYAAASGVVTQAGASAGYGNLITIDHGGGLVTRYAHMYASGVLVKVGQQITVGQQIGKIGAAGYATGCHLHFEVKIDGTFTEPTAVLAEHGIS